MKRVRSGRPCSSRIDDTTPRGLFEHVVALRGVELHGDAVDRDEIGRRVDAAAELGHDAAVHLDAALDDELLGDAPARDARGGEHLLQAHALGRVPPRLAGRADASVTVESLLAVVEQRRDVRQLVERVDAEVGEQQVGGAVEDGARLGIGRRPR